MVEFSSNFFFGEEIQFQIVSKVIANDRFVEATPQHPFRIKGQQAFMSDVAGYTFFLGVCGRRYLILNESFVDVDSRGILPNILMVRMPF